MDNFNIKDRKAILKLIDKSIRDLSCLSLSPEDSSRINSLSNSIFESLDINSKQNELKKQINLLQSSLDNLSHESDYFKDSLIRLQPDKFSFH